jgi:hypothetical protein
MSQWAHSDFTACIGVPEGTTRLRDAYVVVVRVLVRDLTSDLGQECVCRYSRWSATLQAMAMSPPPGPRSFCVSVQALPIQEPSYWP